MPLFALLAATFLADLPARRVALVALAWVYSAALTFSQVSRFSVDQQWQVADAVERASENADAPFVAAPG